MVKRTSKSPKSPAPRSASPTNIHMSDGKMVLRTRSTQKMKQTATEQRKPKSAKKPKTAAKKAAAKIDSNKPKKPPTAFFFYLEDFRKDFQEQNPDVKSMRHIGKACGEKWKTMTYEEKVHYYDVATEKRAEFDRAIADYIKRKESGEEIKSEEDSEYDE